MITSRKLMRRLVLIVLSAFMILGATAGCQSDQPTTASSTTSAAVTTATTGTTTGNTSMATPVPSSPDRLSGPFTEADLVLSIEGKSYTLLSNAAALLGTLGDDCQFSEAESCVYDGFDKTFDYGFAQIFTIPNGSIDLIDGIYLLDDRFETARGIRVGSALADVISAYGDKEDIGGLVYNASGDPENLSDPSLTFIVEDDRVTAISYYSGSNAQGAGNGG